MELRNMSITDSGMYTGTFSGKYTYSGTYLPPSNTIPLTVNESFSEIAVRHQRNALMHGMSQSPEPPEIPFYEGGFIQPSWTTTATATPNVVWEITTNNTTAVPMWKLCDSGKKLTTWSCE